MVSRNAHCTVIEITPPTADSDHGSHPEPRTLLPWADPYIARLLVKHRLNAALSDSLEFMADEAYRDEPADSRAVYNYPDIPARFSRYPSPPGVQ